MPPFETRLHALQAVFLADLMGHAPRRAADRAAVFERPPAGDIEARWGIYTSGYLARAVDAVADDFPALARILGPGPLRSLVARYLATHPPSSFDLGLLGRRLAAYLASDALSAALPFLPDLARLEWLVREAFLAAPGRPLGWDDVVALGAEAVAELPLQLMPGVARLDSEWPLLDLWRTRHQADAEVDVQVLGRPGRVLVWRHGWEARCREIDGHEARILALAPGGRLATLLDRGLDSRHHADAVVAAFQRLIAEGVFVRPTP